MILTLSASCTMLSSRSRVLRSSSYRRGVALKIAILSEGAQLQGRRQERTSHLQHRHGTLRSATTFERVSLSVLHLQYRQTSGCCLFAHTCNVPLVRIQAGVDEALSCSSDHVSVATDFSSLRTRRARLIRSWVSCSACISSAHEEAIEGMGKYKSATCTTAATSCFPPRTWRLCRSILHWPRCRRLTASPNRSVVSHLCSGASVSPPTAAFKAHLNHNDSAVSISILLATSCICNPWLEATKIAAAGGFVEDPMTTQVSEEEEVGATSGAAEAVAEGGEEVDQSTLMSLTRPYSNGQVVGVTFQLPFHDLLK